MSPTYKRWYDHDPLLLEVVELLKNYQDELKSQAEVFLAKIEEQVSKEAIDRFYEMVKPVNGNRWYDNDPVISKTVELLRVVPPEVQKACAQHFINALKDLGINYESPNAKK
ncbi:MAG: hypothetical protein DKM22_06400 [Candidatus Melainabacteria bacterium]|nr:MAG: hypothetical protein DKM22_06400 [Candidatus Melainabacteria bacterium]